MDPLLSEPIVIICGPTATGKSELAQTLARALGGVVLSADSMQVYRGMDIGTAKLDATERRVKHYGLDLADPDEPYSVACYQSYARQVISDLAQSSTPVVMAGGTGLYIQAVIDDLRFPEGEQADNPIRERYMRLAEVEGSQAVWDELHRLDPESASEVHPHNVKRVVRALEMYYGGESYAKRAHGLNDVKNIIPAIQIGLHLERTELYARINARVDAMRDAGLVQEVQQLSEAGFADSLTARQAIGYKEVLAALDGTCIMDEAFDQIKQASRRYAKRQMSWFKRDKRIHWIDITGKTASAITDEAFDILERSSCGSMSLPTLKA